MRAGDKVWFALTDTVKSTTLREAVSDESAIGEFFKTEAEAWEFLAAKESMEASRLDSAAAACRRRSREHSSKAALIRDADKLSEPAVRRS